MPVAPEVLQAIVQISDEIKEDNLGKRLEEATSSARVLMPFNTSRRNHDFGPVLAHTSSGRHMSMKHADIEPPKAKLPPIRFASARATGSKHRTRIAKLNTRSARITQILDASKTAAMVPTGPVKMLERISPRGSASAPGSGSNMVSEAPWGMGSVGDLEALDSILDHLVVLDDRMRSALLSGPLVSFETKFPPPKADARYLHPELEELLRQLRAGQEDRDRTFLTSVAVEGAEAPREPEGGEEDLEADKNKALQDAAQMDRAVSPNRVDVVTSAMGHPPEDRGPPILPAVPVTVPPYRLIRMAVQARASAANMVNIAPPAPPTADHLLQTRPPPFLLSPTYDELCHQIRDVQRQYTCGSVNLTRNTSPGRSIVNVNQYISGLDGPSLDEVVARYDVPYGLEMARPSFVSMTQQRTGRRGSRQKSWAQYGQALEYPHWPDASQVPAPGVAASWDPQAEPPTPAVFETQAYSEVPPRNDQPTTSNLESVYDRPRPTSSPNRGAVPNQDQVPDQGAVADQDAIGVSASGDLGLLGEPLEGDPPSGTSKEGTRPTSNSGPEADPIAESVEVEGRDLVGVGRELGVEPEGLGEGAGTEEGYAISASGASDGPEVLTAAPPFVAPV